MALFKNKDTDKKRKGENVIGKIIYGFLLFAPIMSILFTSLYTVFNKNAYQSYYGDTINNYETTKVTNFNDIKSDTALRINNSTLTPSHNADLTSAKLYISSIINKSDNIPDNTNNIAFGIYTNSFNYHLYCYEDTTQIADLVSNVTFYLDCYVETPIPTNNNALNIILNRTNAINFISYNKYSYLDNSFEYGMYKTEQSNIYNWSKSTGTYTVLQNVCTGIGINNTFVPMLMAYWLLISIIYFLFDIALILIWAVHDKIHALKDAI